MSLFGESPPKARQTKSSLFDDDEPSTKAASGSGLFADGGTANGSPWDFPSPKKQARRNVVKTLLQDVEVPEQYVDAYDGLLAGGEASGSGVSHNAVKKLVGECNISSGDQEKILQTVSGNADGYSRSEFNVVLALIGLAQEGEELGLDAVDERKKKLPVPSLPSMKAPQAQKPPATPTGPSESHLGAQERPRDTREASFGGLESDPWGSPAMHKGHEHSNGNGAYPDGASTGTERQPARTTSAFTTSASEQAGSSTPSFEHTTHPAPGGDGAGWGGDAGFGASSGEQGFEGASGGAGAGSNGLGRSMGAGSRTGNSIEEEVTVNLLEEKEGIFLFQHRNYEVVSIRKGSKVVRRYSDFVWLLDCLYKRYPFRQLPLLPPKRVAINGNHIAADTAFLEKRRRGLARFANALVRHPVLNQEQLVVMFLTVPTELAVWRKQATISVQEEFIGKHLPPGLEDSLPTNLMDQFDTVRSGVRRSAEIYINLCNMVEKLAKYNTALAGEYMRLSTAFDNLTEVSHETYALDTNEVPLLNEGLKAASKHMTTNRSLLDDESRAWDFGVLEDLKRQRDCLVSVREMFDRRDRYAKDNIPQLERRITANENKLAGLRAKPEGQVKPGEAEKVEDAIVKDKQSIVDQHARGVFIKECIKDEVLFFNNSQHHISRLHQDWSQERVKYAELGADNWRRLSEEVEGMPVGE